MTRGALAGSYVDKMAGLMYDCPPSDNRRELENQAVNQTQRLWKSLQEQVDRDRISPEELKEKLNQLDSWLKGKLSGSSYLSLLRTAEMFHPNFIELMPEILMSRYEEMRVARIWSALFEPEALVRLRSAVETEKALMSGIESGGF